MRAAALVAVVVVAYLVGTVAASLFSPDPCLGALDDTAPGDINQIRLPAGFAISYYAKGVSNARQMAQSASNPNLLYVGTRTEGTVHALVQSVNGSIERVTVAHGLHMPNGVAWHQGALYVAEVDRILRFSNIDATFRNVAAPVIVLDNMPVANEDWHAWKVIKFSPTDGKLYIPSGAPCNFCLRSSPPGDPVTDITTKPFASIFRADVLATPVKIEMVAQGIRNCVGMDWSPVTNALWFTDNGRDNWGSEKPHDEMNVVTKTLPEHFGFPFCYGTGNNDTSGGNDPQFRAESCDPKVQSTYTPAAWEMGPHVAATGMVFYNYNTGSNVALPVRYKNAAIVTEHGSWNRPYGKHTGYRIHVLFYDPSGTKVIGEEILADGWLNADHQTKWGRPADVIIDSRDGSLLVSDDFNNAVYRITYTAPVADSQYPL